MTITRTVLIGCSLLVIAATGTTAKAEVQNPQAPMMGNMGTGGWGPGMMGHSSMGAGMMGPGMMIGSGPMMQGQLTYLKAELGITDAQKAAWQAYVNAVQARSSIMQEMRTRMMQAWKSGTALDRMDAHFQAMQSMLDSMKAVRPATETLYNTLTDNQKKKADLLLGNGCCMM